VFSIKKNNRVLFISQEKTDALFFRGKKFRNIIFLNPFHIQNKTGDLKDDIRQNRTPSVKLTSPIDNSASV